jgi:hypothetical protein
VAVSGRTKRGPRGRAARTVVVAVLSAAALAGISGCNTNPHTPDIAAPPSAEPAAAGSHHSSGNRNGVQLPNTISLSYDHPSKMDLAHQMVLWNVSQAIKSELQAMYEKTSAATPNMQRFWTGAGYATALAQASTWIAAKQQPVGRVVVTGTTVQSLTGQQATVTYCQDMTMVHKGIAKTNTVKAPVQAKEQNGDRYTLTLTPTGPKGTWQVSAVATVKQSTQCPPLDDAHLANPK